MFLSLAILTQCYRYNALLVSRHPSLVAFCGYGVYVVWTDRWPYKRQDLIDNLKELFLNVPSDHLHSFFADLLNYVLCTPAVNLMFLPCCARDAIIIMFTTNTL